MKRIAAISLFLLFLAGPKDRVHAATSGSYKCFLSQGSFDGGQTYTLPVIYHYNPNKTPQNIKRIRIFDAAGKALVDQSYPSSPTQGLPPPLPVPPFGSIQIAVKIQGGVTIPPAPPTADLSTETGQGLQFIINWSQGSNTAAPTPRAELRTFEIDIDPAFLLSVAQTTCP